jgi:hypothetical protein
MNWSSASRASRSASMAQADSDRLARWNGPSRSMRAVLIVTA